MKSWFLLIGTVAVIGFLATVSIDGRFGETPRPLAARAQINSFMLALDLYKQDTGLYPSTAEGLEALRVRPGSAQHWQGPYLAKDIPLDPWGHEYIYRFPGTHSATPEIVSYGSDGRSGGEGLNADIESWK